jgi:hypothetical protein
MTDALDGVRDDYRAIGLTERLKAALGPEEQQLTPQQLATVDTGGPDVECNQAVSHSLRDLGPLTNGLSRR